MIVMPTQRKLSSKVLRKLIAVNIKHVKYVILLNCLEDGASSYFTIYLMHIQHKAYGKSDRTIFIRFIYMENIL